MTIIAVPALVLSQPKPFSPEEIDRMVVTYTYYIAQKASLESISERYPQLKEYALNAEAEWEKEFKSSVTEINKNLSIIKEASWESDKVNIYVKYRGADHSNVSEKEARQFIDIIFQRSYGKIQSPIIETLLTFKPAYEAFPEKEFSDGYVNNFLTSNFKKKTNTDIKIVYPKSWETVAGSSSKNNIHQVFNSKFGAGRLTLSFLLESTANIPIAKIPLLLAEDYLKKNCLKNDSILAYSSALKIDNCPAARLVFIRKELEIDKKYTILFETYHTYYQNNHITLIFNYTSDNTNIKDIKADYYKYQKLIRKITSNVVILSQWEQKRF